MAGLLNAARPATAPQSPGGISAVPSGEETYRPGIAGTPAGRAAAAAGRGAAAAGTAEVAAAAASAAGAPAGLTADMIAGITMPLSRSIAWPAPSRLRILDR